jgi:hypothetical protein
VLGVRNRLLAQHSHPRLKVATISLPVYALTVTTVKLEKLARSVIRDIGVKMAKRTPVLRTLFLQPRRSRRIIARAMAVSRPHQILHALDVHQVSGAQTASVTDVLTIRLRQSSAISRPIVLATLVILVKMGKSASSALLVLSKPRMVQQSAHNANLEPILRLLVRLTPVLAFLVQPFPTHRVVPGPETLANASRDIQANTVVSAHLALRGPTKMLLVLGSV